MNFSVLSVAALAVLTVMVSGQGYELDPQKVEERRNLILGIVSRGIPYGAHTSYKPRIGSAYAYPSVGYNRGYSVPAGYGGYNPGRPYYAPYNQPRGYNSAGYPRVAQPSYGGNMGYNPTGYKFGGGRVHPIFNNELLYRPKVNNDGLGSFGSQDPIFIGGGPSKATPTSFVGQSGTSQKGLTSAPQFNAFGIPNAEKKVFTGSDTIGATYTGQPGTLYQNLPGYTNPYFGQA